MFCRGFPDNPGTAMSAEAVAAKARNPQHVCIEAPEDLSAHAKTEPSSQPMAQPSPSPFANGAVREVKSDAGLRGSSQDSGSTTSRPGVARASLPPEILGLYNRSDPQDRQPSNPPLQVPTQESGLFCAAAHDPASATEPPCPLQPPGGTGKQRQAGRGLGGPESFCCCQWHAPHRTHGAQGLHGG